MPATQAAGVLTPANGEVAGTQTLSLDDKCYQH